MQSLNAEFKVVQVTRFLTRIKGFDVVAVENGLLLK